MAARRQHKYSQLVQERCTDPSSAIDLFKNESDGKIRLVAIPDPPLPCRFYYTIPSGAHHVLTHCGHDPYPGQEGNSYKPGGSLISPGLHCGCWWDRIAFSVTESSTTYEAPVKSVATKDNVMVDCDMTLIFRIGPEPHMVKAFVFRLGAYRFNSYLAAAVEESIRQLIRGTTHDRVYELRGGEPCRNLLNELNHKFGEFGVSFTSAIITDVRLSPDLDMRLQATTRFETEMKEMVKRHEHAVQAIDYDGSKKVDELKRAQDREIQDLVAEETRERLNREAQIVEQNDHKATDTIAAQEQAKVAEIKAQSELDAAKAQGNADAARLIAVAEAEAEQIKIAAKKTSEVRLLKSDNDVLCAKENAEAIRVLGQVEAKHAKNLADKREFEENLARFGAYKKLARNGRMMVSGKNGERIINELLGLGNANAQKGK